MDFRGRQPQDYEEMLQEFFEKCWEKNSLGRADPAKGTFRSWVITVFKNTVRNEDRKGTWGPTPNTNQKDYPKGGLVSTNALLETYGPLMEPRADDTPETLFERVYFYRVRTDALEDFREMCEVNDQVRRYQVFTARYIEPFDNTMKQVPDVGQLSREFAFPSEEACRRVLASALRDFRSIVIEKLALDCSSTEQAECECDVVVKSFLAN
jgi:DNA-directed RNA polymerase specialized sigma24 family protein